MVALVVGTQGLAPDEEILTRPGHARRCRAFAEWVTADVAPTALAWAKSDPTRIETELPSLIRNRLADTWDSAIAKYGHVIYVAVDPRQLDDSQMQRTFHALLDFYMEERRVSPLAGYRDEAQNARRDTLAKVLASAGRQQVHTQLALRRFVIVQGPPGTGKTRLARLLLSDEYGGQGRSHQFHPSVGYEDFIGGLAPMAVGGQFGFKPRAGVLMRAAAESAACIPRPYLLHLDEVNRADLARVLGEALFLFEPERAGEPARSIRLAHDFGEPWHDTFALPANLHVLGTMNSADRTTAIIDLAVRRRFAFLSLWPERSALDGAPSVATEAFDSLLDIFLNEGSDASLELMPGHAYFLCTSDDEARRRLATELRPLLLSYLQQGLVPELVESIDTYLQWLATR